MGPATKKNAEQPVVSCPASGRQTSQRDRQRRKILPVALGRPIGALNHDRAQLVGGELHHGIDPFLLCLAEFGQVVVRPTGWRCGACVVDLGQVTEGLGRVYRIPGAGLMRLGQVRTIPPDPRWPDSVCLQDDVRCWCTCVRFGRASQRAQSPLRGD
jgi:hypothetical protein